MLYITEKAANKIKEFADSEGLVPVVRVKILSGGCSGFYRDMQFENTQTDLDEIVKFDDIKLLVDPFSFHYLDETTIDYEDNMFGGGFRFNSPTITGSCGCGKSVSF